MKPLRAVFALILLMAVMTAISWQKWANPVIDGGREMNMPLRLLHGESIYSEAYYLYGPVAPCFNALLYKLFGIRLGTLYAAGAAASLLLVLLIFHLGCGFMTAFEAMVAGAAVLLLCVFKQGGNTIFPYSYAALYGTVLGTLALIAQVGYVRSDRKSHLFAAGALSGLAICCKLEFGFAAIASLLVIIISARRGQRMRIALLSLAALLIFPLLIYGLLFARIPAESLIKDAFYFPRHIPAELIYFNKLKLGLNTPGRTLREMVSALALLCGVAGAISLVSLRLAGGPLVFAQSGPGRRLRWILWLTLASLGLLLAHVLVFGTHWDMNPFRALPVLLLGVVCGCVKARRGPGGMDASTRALLAVSVFSLMVLARVISRVPAGGAYGADLIPVPLMLFVYIALAAPPFLTASAAAGQYGRRMVSLLLSVALIASMGVIGFRYVKSYPFWLCTPRGDLRLPTSIGLAMNQAIEFLARNSGPREYILALPEGSSLNFLADRPVPLRYEIITPGFLTDQAEQEAIHTIQEKDVRFIFLFNRATSEFGPKAFGRDYCRTLMRWIDANYALAEVFGEQAASEIQIGSSQFFIKCYRRKQPELKAGL